MLSQFSKIKKSEVDDVVLAGGSARIAKMQQLLNDYLGGKTFTKSINFNEAITFDAAVQPGISPGNEAMRDGILKVSASDKFGGQNESIRINNYNQDRLSKKGIEWMLEEGERYAEEDKRNYERIDAKNTTSFIWTLLSNHKSGKLGHESEESSFGLGTIGRQIGCCW
jgi:molecular chaperone DnaK (HSP70)